MEVEVLLDNHGIAFIPDYPSDVRNLVFIVSQCMIRDAVIKSQLKLLKVHTDRDSANRNPSTLLSVEIQHGRYFFYPNILPALRKEVKLLILEMGLMQDTFSVWDLEVDGTEWGKRRASFLDSYRKLNVAQLAPRIEAQITSGNPFQFKSLRTGRPELQTLFTELRREHTNARKSDNIRPIARNEPSRLSFSSNEQFSEVNMFDEKVFD